MGWRERRGIPTLPSPATRLWVQQHQSSILYTGLLWGESIGDLLIPPRRASDGESVSISWHHHVEHTLWFVFWSVQHRSFTVLSCSVIPGFSLKFLQHTTTPAGYVKLFSIKKCTISNSPVAQLCFPLAVSSPNNVYQLISRTTNRRLYSNSSQILLLYKVWGYHNIFDSMKSLGVYYRHVKMLRCGCVEHGLQYIT